ncbi:MAG TPA: hypothetical protein VIK55_11135 [Paludibacter sp.]
MNLKSHIPTSAKDDSWYNHYVSKIGEESLFKIKNYIYDLCDKLKVGEHLDIQTWIDHTHKKCAHFKDWMPLDSTDLFIKIIWCYMTESNGTYCFSNDYSQFRNYINARTLDKQSSLHNREYQDKNT